MTSEPPLEHPWKIAGPVGPAKLSGSYRVGAILASIGMILLPLIYIGMIAGLGWWLYDFASSGPSVSTGKRKTSAVIVTYVVPLVIGSIALLFMVKPLFSRRPKSVDPRALRREDEPQLFAFIEQICDLVGAPRPRKVLVDLNVNASASLTHGAWSLFSRNLTLTIGLPLAAGLTARQFGGVLAHEFGHFAQGAGMKTTYAVRAVSFWFARVVYERDRMDAALENWANNIDLRVGIVLHAARLLIWCVRRILWVLMWVGQLISCGLMRQMEFDADHYEIQTAGSDSFIATAKQLRVLGLGAHLTHQKQDEAYQAKRLVDDLPGWVLHETRQLPEQARVELEKSAVEEKTGWFDTHPSDAERIARAEKAKSAGVLQTDLPASALFRDFGALSREVTGAFYREVLELKPGSIILEPLAKMTSESDDAKRGDEAVEQYFDGIIGARAMVFVTPADLAVEDRGPVDRRPANEEEKALGKELHEGMNREFALRSVLGMEEARIAWRPEELKLASTKDAAGALRKLTERMAELDTQMAPVLIRMRARLSAAVRAYLAAPDSPAETQAEVRRCIATLNFIEGIHPNLRDIVRSTAPLGAILQHMEASANQEALYMAVQRITNELRPAVETVLERSKVIVFPLPHARGTVNMREYLLDGVAHGDPMILTFLRGDAILSRVYAIYRRIIGRLVLIAQGVEARMDPPSTAAT